MSLQMSPQPRRPLSGTGTILLPLSLEARASLRELIDIISGAGRLRRGGVGSDVRA